MPIAGIYGPDDFGNPVHAPPAAPTRTRISPAERARALPMPSLEWTPEVERATAHLYERVKNVISRRRRFSIASPTSAATRCSSRSKRQK